MRTSLFRSAGLAATLLAVPMLACSDDEDSNPCSSSMNLNSATSPEGGSVTVGGSFADGENIFAKYTSGGNSQTVLGSFTESTVTFTGLPSGDLALTFVVTCSKVTTEQTFGTKTVTVQ